MKEIHVGSSFHCSQPPFQISNLDLREHAIFTLRILLENNQENQQFVDSLKPSQEWDSDGTLKTIVGAVLK